jgi:hypothetical protein
MISEELLPPGKEMPDKAIVWGNVLGCHMVTSFKGKR